MRRGRLADVDPEKPEVAEPRGMRCASSGTVSGESAGMVDGPAPGIVLCASGVSGDEATCRAVAANDCVG